MYKVRLILAAFLALQMKLSSGQTCTQEGFFRNPDDCSKFYRCVDLWQNGRGLTIYNFDCPVGTVFDEAVSVCNWPQLAAPCSNDNTNPGVGGSTANPSESTESIGEMSTTEVNPAGPGSEDGSVGSGSGGDNGESVILTPSFSFQCDGEGIFEHANDCSKFWICELDGGNNAESQLYICPDNYLFDNQKLRCVKKEMVNCNKKPDLAKIHLEPQGIKLRLSDLDSFFSRYSSISIISV